MVINGHAQGLILFETSCERAMMECKKDSSRIVLNISGNKFEVSKSKLLKYPDTRLGRLARSVEKVEMTEFYFDRPAMPFESVLTFYQTGKLHLPLTICPHVFKDELDYWEINYDNMDQCCLLNYVQFMDDYKTKTEFQAGLKQRIESIETVPVSVSNRHRVWRIIDYKERTWMAKLYLFIGICMVVLSVVTLALSTLPRYRRSPTMCEWSEYANDGLKVSQDVITFFKMHDCKKIMATTKGRAFDLKFDHENENDDDDDDDDDNDDDDLKDNKNGNSSLPKPPKPETTPATNSNVNVTFPDVSLKYDIFNKIDYLATAFFTIEFLLRILVCPNLKSYFINFLNLIDGIVLVGTYIEIIIINMKTSFKYSQAVISFFDFIKLLRVFRLLRYCQHLAAVQVLKYSMKQNAKDLLVLLFHIMIILLIFANIIYLAEDRENIDSIPQGWWLGLITLTTVGYGDLSPRSLAGKLTCSVCALCGIMMLSLIIPIFVDTFVSLYGIAHIGTIPRGQKEKKTSNNTTEVQKIDLSKL